MNGRKRYFKNEQVRRVNVPRYRQLTLTKVVDHSKTPKPRESLFFRVFEKGEKECDRREI